MALVATRPPAAVAAAKQPRMKIFPSRITGKVLEWKGKHGWIQPDTPISHPQAMKNAGKIFLAQADVEAEIDGIGARVSFFVYADGTGLGAMNVRPHGAEVVKTVIKPLTPQQVGPKTVQARTPLQPQKPGLRPQVAKAGTGPQLISATRPAAPGSTGPRAVVPPGKMKPGTVVAARPVAATLTPSKPGIIAPTKIGAARSAGPVGAGKGAAPGKGAAAVAATPLGGSGGKGAAAAAVAPKGKGKGAPGPRYRLGEDPVMGTVKTWKGTFGWIELDEPLDNFKGLVYIGLGDCEDKEAMSEGVQVTFYTYKDGRGVGAECCAVGLAPAEGMKRSPEAPAGGAPAVVASGPVLVTKPAKAKPAGVPALLKPSGGAAPQATKVAVKPPTQGIKRKRITELEVMGEVTTWKGSFGWITPQEPIEHEQASKNEGRVKVMASDIVGDTKKLEEGQLVQFHVSADASGLCAEECLPF